MSQDTIFKILVLNPSFGKYNDIWEISASVNNYF